MIPKAICHILACTFANSFIATTTLASTQASEQLTETKGTEGTVQNPKVGIQQQLPSTAIPTQPANSANLQPSPPPSVNPSVLQPAIPPPLLRPRTLQRAIPVPVTPPRPMPPPMHRQIPPRIRPTLSDVSKRLTEKLDKAQTNYDIAKNEKEKDKSAYIIALVDLAIACHDNKEIEKAAQLYSEACGLYFKLGKNSPDEKKCRVTLYRHFGYLPPEEFESKFERLLLIAEKKTSSEWTPISELNRFISTAASDQNSHQRDSKFDELQFWQSVIRIRSSVRGPDDPTLSDLLVSYAYYCEHHSDLTEAEDAFIRNINLKRIRASGVEFNAKILLSEFYVRNKMFDKANACWLNLKQSLNPRLSSGYASSLAQLAENYLSANRRSDAIEIAFAVIDAGGNGVLAPFNSLFEKILAGDLANFEYYKAQALLKRRVEASERDGYDYNASYWRLKLSDVDLALGEFVDSEKLFEEVRIGAALHHQDVDKLLKNRATLIQSLKK
jgi:hypothetical protein